MFYLRTIISEKYELKYIKLQLSESLGFVDKVIVCEYDITHTGKPRNCFFGEVLKGDYFSQQEKERILYLQPDIRGEAFLESDYPEGLTGEQMHFNERLFRGVFAKYVNLRKRDIVLCADADEIVFRRNYPKLLKKMKKGIKSLLFPTKICYTLKVYQFFYRPDYLWDDAGFFAPCICYACRHMNEYPAQWRDEGKYLEEYYGCHFSWCMTVGEMVEKLSNYAHNDLYSNLANREVLSSAIKNKVYPFDPKRPFHITVVNSILDAQFYPDTYEQHRKEFEQLLEQQFD